VSKPWFWVVCGLIVATGLTASVSFMVEGLPGHDTNTWHAAAVIGSLLVAVGWMVTSLNNIRSRELEYTLRLLANYRVSPESKNRWAIINEFLKTGQTLSLHGNKGEPICDAVSGELDDYEFIASGAMQGIYDNKILRYELRSDFALLYGLAEQYIQEIQVDDEDPEIWEYFCALCKRWAEATDHSERNAKVFLCAAAFAALFLVILRWGPVTYKALISHQPH
jgi:hypothetical protein